MVPSVIGEDLTITGNVACKGEIQVDGKIHGDIHCSSLLLGDKAHVNGGVVAEDVVVRGHLMGTIRGVLHQLGDALLLQDAPPRFRNLEQYLARPRIVADVIASFHLTSLPPAERSCRLCE